MLSLGFSVTLLTFIIVPKIRRVMSGEKVVISNILGSRFNRAPPSNTSSEGTHENEIVACNGQLHSLSRIPVGEYDPLPSFIEKNVMDLETVCRQVTAKW